MALFNHVGKDRAPRVWRRLLSQLKPKGFLEMFYLRIVAQEVVDILSIRHIRRAFYKSALYEQDVASTIDNKKITDGRSRINARELQAEIEGLILLTHGVPDSSIPAGKISRSLDLDRLLKLDRHEANAAQRLGAAVKQFFALQKMRLSGVS